MVELNETELDPIVSTVRYEAMKLCTRSVQDSNNDWHLVVLSQYEAVPGGN